MQKPQLGFQLMLRIKLKRRLRGVLPPRESVKRKMSFPKGNGTHSSLGYSLWLRSRLQVPESQAPLGDFRRLCLSTYVLLDRVTRVLMYAQYKLSLVGISAKPLLRNSYGDFCAVAKLQLGSIVQNALNVYWMMLRRQSKIDKRGRLYWEPP